MLRGENGMSVYDDIFRMMREADRILSPLRDLERLGGSSFQQITKEFQERERLFRATLPELYNIYPSAIASVQRTIEKQLSELDRCRLPMNLLLEAHSSLSGLLSKQADLNYLTQTGVALGPQWQDSIKAYQHLGGGVNAAELALMSHYTLVAESAFLAQERLLRVPWESIGGATQLNPIEFSGIIKGFTTLMEAYRPLMQSFEERGHFIASLPPITSGGPPLEILTSSRVLGVLSISPQEEDYPEVYHQAEVDFENEIEASTDELLTLLNPGLRLVWIGAREALRSGNPDRARHVSISLRELITQVLHALAPDDQVQAWTSNSSHFHEGRPTREARVLFICRGVDHGTFSEFVRADVRASIEFIKLFNRGSHELSISFSETQIHALVSRTDSLLRFLLLTDLTSR